ncbi:MAG: arsenic efflux protein [Clostridia bacterium]|nr:arsenic efflux protein [Clostridia bacterium]
MHEFWHILEHALIDTLKIAPVLLVVYFLIEFLEYKKIMQFQNSKMLKGKASPVFGSLFGSLPQCGFSVVSTDLFTKGFVSIGALLAVYIATSDEALPIMLSHHESWLSLLALIVCKIALGIIVGYLAMWLYPKVFKTKNIHFDIQNKAVVKNGQDKHNHLEVGEHIHEEHNHHEHLEYEHNEEIHNKDLKVEQHDHIGCCNHDLEGTKFDWKHPLLHCLKILLFILVINLVFGAIVEWVGEDNLTEFLSQSSALQPLLAVLIGLIPNCASSVVITELYLLGGLSFGAILAGLSVNAGLGLMVLFKQDKNPKEIAFILAMLIIPSLLAGYALHFII